MAGRDRQASAGIAFAVCFVELPVHAGVLRGILFSGKTEFDANLCIDGFGSGSQSSAASCSIVVHSGIVRFGIDLPRHLLFCLSEKECRGAVVAVRCSNMFSASSV